MRDSNPRSSVRVIKARASDHASTESAYKPYDCQKIKFIIYPYQFIN
jgi:hypothetical protein